MRMGVQINTAGQAADAKVIWGGSEAFQSITSAKKELVNDLVRWVTLKP